MKDSKDIVEELPCQLTGDEVIERSQKLAGLHQQQLEIEDKKKQAVNEFGARLKKVGGEIHYLSNIITSGKEARNVKCRLDYFWAEGKKILVRLDTREVVSEEVISDFERQQHIDFVERENGEAAKKKAGEEWPEEKETVSAPEECQEFGNFLASEEVCQICNRSEKCFAATPEGDGEVEEETAPVEPESKSCVDCGSPEGELHGEVCPQLFEDEGTDESEGESGQDDSGEGEPEANKESPEEGTDPGPDQPECFSTFDANDAECANCDQKEGCYTATIAKEEEVPAEEVAEEEESADDHGDDSPPQYQCAKCEKFFSEPEEGEGEEYSACPHCKSTEWY
jgi:hypothetical protein